MSQSWWVNHNQTFRQEIDGEYLWSPRREANGARSQFYENMRHASPGDVVLSFAGTLISFVGKVTDWAFAAPRPTEFGSAGTQWASAGWLLPVAWKKLPSPVRPKDLLSALAPLLPKTYSPISATTGNGNQKAYLAAVPHSVVDLILSRAGQPETPAPASSNATFRAFSQRLDDAVQEQLMSDLRLSDTERQQVLKARRGQGQFRENVCAIESACRLTGVSNQALLVASHIKPWRSCETGNERLDGNNGLLLTPDADLLFDRGLISFRDDGRVLVSPRLDPDDLRRLGLEDKVLGNTGRFSPGQSRYLAFHRESSFLPA